MKQVQSDNKSFKSYLCSTQFERDDDIRKPKNAVNKWRKIKLAKFEKEYKEKKIVEEKKEERKKKKKKKKKESRVLKRRSAAVEFPKRSMCNRRTHYPYIKSPR